MENYIVRIYRREKNSPDHLLGIVEKTDSGDNQTFRSFEELYDIFFPEAMPAEPTGHKQIVEQRKYRRFYIKEGTLTFNATTDVGEITDISMGGLAFSSTNAPTDSAGPLEVCILCGDKELFVENIQCKRIIARHQSDNPALIEQSQKRNYSIEFADLTPAQHYRLKHIIQHHTLGEA